MLLAHNAPPPLGGVDALPRDSIWAALDESRRRTLALIEPVAEGDLDRQHSQLMSPLAWDLGHIAAFEDLWLARATPGLEPLRPELWEVYDATETPRSGRGDLPYLRHDEARRYLDEVHERAAEVLEGADVSPDGDGLHAGGYVWWLVTEHEHQHNETMLQALHLAPRGVYAPERAAAPENADDRGPEMVALEGGPCPLGADADLAYDNERPRFTQEVEPVEIDREPVSNGAFLEFVEAGGYGRPDWWSEEGWRWREREGVERPLFWTADGLERSFDRLAPIDPGRPVVHVSWYEADAFARAHGKRLPTEAEWELAASWSPGSEHKRSFPWGDEPPDPGRANLDAAAFAPLPPGAHRDGASPEGVLALAGDVWEWTASRFEGYPGFRAFPYPEYSEVFFGGDYRVLRGGSWATRPGIARATFRNWDHPQRRQIFAGFRCAREVR